MANLTRVYQNIFGSAAGVNQISQFGSLAADAPAFTTDPATMQALGNWLTGWFGAVIGGNSPAIEDMNAFCYVVTYQLAYLLQKGIPEWNSSTIYYQNDMVMGNGLIYVSKTNSNQGNAISNKVHWKVYLNNLTGVTTDYTALATDDNIYLTSAATANATITLPEISTCIGKTFKLKNRSNYQMKIKGNGSQLIDTTNEYDLDPVSGIYPSITIFNNGSTWDIF